MVVKIEVIKVPQDFLAPRKMQRALKRTLDETAKGVKKDFEKTVATWENQPRFVIVKTRSTRIVRPDKRQRAGKIFNYVDRGTRPHIIKPRRARALRFRVPYRAKTSPGVIGSGAGGKGNKVISNVRAVRHPGTKSRGFSLVINEKWAKKMPAIFLKEVNKVLGE